MTYTINNNYKYDDTDIWNLLILRLNQENIQNIEVIAPIGDGLGTQLLTQLQEEYQRNGMEQRTIIVPYNLGNYHWVGLLVKINNGAITVNYYDSLQSSIPEQIITEINQAYQTLGVIAFNNLRGLYQADGTSCGPLMIENLVNAVLNNELDDIAYIPTIRQAHIDLMNEYHAEQRFAEKQFKNLNLIPKSYFTKKVDKVSITSEDRDIVSNIYQLCMEIEQLHQKKGLNDPNSFNNICGYDIFVDFTQKLFRISELTESLSWVLKNSLGNPMFWRQLSLLKEHLIGNTTGDINKNLFHAFYDIFHNKEFLNLGLILFPLIDNKDVDKNNIIHSINKLSKYVGHFYDIIVIKKIFAHLQALLETQDYDSRLFKIGLIRILQEMGEFFKSTQKSTVLLLGNDFPERQHFIDLRDSSKKWNPDVLINLIAALDNNSIDFTDIVEELNLLRVRLDAIHTNMANLSWGEIKDQSFVVSASYVHAQTFDKLSKIIFDITALTALQPTSINFSELFKDLIKEYDDLIKEYDQQFAINKMFVLESIKSSSAYHYGSLNELLEFNKLSPTNKIFDKIKNAIKKLNSSISENSLDDLAQKILDILNNTLQGKEREEYIQTAIPKILLEDADINIDNIEDKNIFLDRKFNQLNAHKIKLNSLPSRTNESGVKEKAQEIAEQIKSLRPAISDNVINQIQKKVKEIILDPSIKPSEAKKQIKQFVQKIALIKFDSLPEDKSSSMSLSSIKEKFDSNDLYYHSKLNGFLNNLSKKGLSDDALPDVYIRETSLLERWFADRVGVKVKTVEERKEHCIQSINRVLEEIKQLRDILNIKDESITNIEPKQLNDYWMLVLQNETKVIRELGKNTLYLLNIKFYVTIILKHIENLDKQFPELRLTDKIHQLYEISAFFRHPEPTEKELLKIEGGTTYTSHNDIIIRQTAELITPIYKILSLASEAVRGYSAEPIHALIDEAPTNPNNSVVLNMIPLYNNLLLHHQKILIQTYKLAGTKAVDFLLELSADQFIAEQIMAAVDEVGLEKVLEIFFSDKINGPELNASQTKEQKTLTATKDEQILEDIAKIETIIGKEALAQVAGFYQYVSNALSNNQYAASSTKVIKTISGLIQNLYNTLDLGALYENIDLNNKITIILIQLDNVFDLVASGPMQVSFPRRPPHFDPDDDHGGFGNSDNSINGNNDNNTYSEAINLSFYYGVGCNSTFSDTDIKPNY